MLISSLVLSALLAAPLAVEPIPVSATPVTKDVVLLVYADGGAALATLDMDSGTQTVVEIQNPATISPMNQPSPGELSATWVDKQNVTRKVYVDCKGLTLKNCVKTFDALYQAMVALYPPV